MKKGMKEKICQVLDENPMLNYEGLTLPKLNNKRESHKHREERLKLLREHLLTEEATHEVANVLKWLETSNKTRKTRLLNTKYSSFGLKTYVEQDMGTYISNGSFIVGALLFGCKAESVNASENAHLNLRVKP